MAVSCIAAGDGEFNDFELKKRQEAIPVEAIGREIESQSVNDEFAVSELENGQEATVGVSDVRAHASFVIHESATEALCLQAALIR